MKKTRMSSVAIVSWIMLLLMLGALVCFAIFFVFKPSQYKHNGPLSMGYANDSVILEFYSSHTGSPELVGQQEVVFGADYTSIDVESPNIEGYKFLGWSREGDGEILGPGATFNKKTTRLFARWELESVSNKVLLSLCAPNAGIDLSQNIIVMQKGITKRALELEGKLPKNTPYIKFWSLTKNGTEIPDDYVFTENTTLYPVWQNEILNYNLNLNANGGAFKTGSENATINVTKREASLYSLPLEVPQRESYVFVGWSESVNGETLPSDYIVNSPTTLYAVWRTVTPTLGSAETFSITFYDGENVYSNYSMTVSGNTYIGSLALPFPTKENYIFVGWSLNKSSTISNEFLLNSNLNLYARWSKDKLSTEKVCVSFYTNGGETSDNCVVEIDKSSRASALSSLIPNVKREGYIFSGWSLSKEEKILLSKNLNKFISENTCIYALWQKDKVYGKHFNVTLLSEQPDGLFANGTNVLMFENVLANTTLSSLDFLAPTRTGYYFAGLKTSDNLTVDENAKKIRSNLTLYVDWQPTGANEQIRVVFDSNDGTFANDAKTIVKYIKKNTTLTNAISDINVTRKFYNFDAWTINEIALELSDTLTSSTKLVATWQSKTLTIHGLGETSISCLMTEPLPSYLEEDGKMLVGYALTEGGEVEYEAGQTITDEHENLYAIWE